MPTFKTARAKATALECDVLAVPIYKGGVSGPGAAEVEKKLGISFKALLDSSRAKGEPGEALLVPALGKIKAKQVLLVGVGSKGDGAAGARKAGAVVARKTGASATVATTITQAVGGPAADAVAAFVEGYQLGAYRFDRYKSNGTKSKTRTV